MVNYDKSIIYKICCKDLSIQDIYIGSTTNFRRRKCKHKKDCYYEKAKSYNYKVYKFIRDNGGWENWEMVFIKEIKCNSKLELHAEERKIIEEFGSSLNSYIPNRNHKERYEMNKKESYIKQDKANSGNKLGIRYISEEMHQGKKHYTFNKKGYKRKRFNQEKYTLDDVIEYKKSILNI